MASMKAVHVREDGEAEDLYIDECERPEPGPGELLIEVHTTALNRADIFQRKGHYPPPEGASEILGLEAAGTVAELGPDCAGWTPGDRVLTLLSGGGYAEYVTVPQSLVMAMPPKMSFREAAAIPEVFLTAYQALHWLGDLKSGERILIHAGGSGVGTAAIQLAKEAGAEPIITASQPKHALCRELGAVDTIDYREENFADRVESYTGGEGVDFILDFIGAPYVEPNIRSLAMDGRIVLLATLGGSKVDEFDLRSLFSKRASLITSTLRSRDLDYKIQLTEDFAGYALPLFVDGTLQPVIDSTFDWKDVTEAHKRMEANENAGKIVLEVRSKNPQIDE